MPEVQGRKYAYTPTGMQAARKARERVMTSDGMMLGKATDMRKKARAGVMNKPTSAGMIGLATAQANFPTKSKVEFPRRTV